MKTYHDLDLVKVRDACGLDFASHIYGNEKCSCFDPRHMPAKYWAKGKRPKRIIKSHDKNGRPVAWIYDRDIYDVTYIRFKNAKKGRGYNKILNDPIKDNTCIEYNFASEEQKLKVCAMLQAQLGDDYEMEVPGGKYGYIGGCIGLHLKNKEVTA